MSVSAPRRAAYEVVRRTFEDGAWTDRAFRSTAERNGLEGRELAQAQRLAYGAVQRRGTSDHLIEDLARRGVDDLDPPLLAALRLGLYELLFAAATPDHAAVDQAVSLARNGMRGSGPRGGAAAGLVNAVLRRAAGERERLLAGLGEATPEEAAIALSYPTWMAAMWWDELGADDARSLMRAMNEPAEIAFRLNSLLADPCSVVDGLRAAGVAATRPPPKGLLGLPETLVIDGPTGAEVARRVRAGEIAPQSRASQAVAVLLDPRRGERVLDLCAAPGLKTTHLAARMEDDGEVRSFERDAGRAAALEELCGRMGAGSVRVTVADAAVADLGDGYDRVLVDPPCTDLGTLASRPDARWRKSAAQLESLASLQRELLSRGAAAMRAGGTLVYSTCTISRAENESTVAAVLAADPSLAADHLGHRHPALASPHDRRCLQTRPDRDRTAGFFLARLRRRAA